MSASLVGSEMCIRDSAAATRFYRFDPLLGSIGTRCMCHRVTSGSGRPGAVRACGQKLAVPDR
eukprot:3788628-Alexandrium_andersonii.AAC.1